MYRVMKHTATDSRVKSKGGRRRRPTLRWKDCVKIYLEKADMESRE